MLRLAALTAFLLIAPAAGGEDLPPNSCIGCHGDLLEEAEGDIHRAAAVTCVDCHGGDPGAEEQERAMSPARGYIGVPTAMAAANMCGRCHADIERMRVINPRLPTDQLAQYRTSEHGKLAEWGNDRVATCVSCHGAHGVRSVGDPASPASKARIVDTCSTCHNPEYMEGVAIATDQREKYELSVHGRKRLEERDLAAPACNDCHGNHGAAPPGVFAVTHVCGSCHATQAELFEGSTHAAHFRDLDAPPCTTCHGHHEVLPTGDHMLGTGEQGTCAACHTPGDHCDEATIAMKEGMSRLGARTQDARASLERARRVGMDVERPTFDLAGAEDALVRARAEIHAFSKERLQAIVDEGVGIADEVERAAELKLEEHQFRRKGLAAASAMLLMFAGLLALRAHRLEKRRLEEDR
jgi:hypothetical protein